MRAEALENVKRYRACGPMFTARRSSASVNGLLGRSPSARSAAAPTGRAASYDPETHTVYAQAANAGVSLLGLVEPPKGFSDIRYVAGVAGRQFRVSEGPGFGSAADAPQAEQSTAKRPPPPAPARSRARAEPVDRR